MEINQSLSGMGAAAQSGDPETFRRFVLALFNNEYTSRLCINSIVELFKALGGGWVPEEETSTSE